MPRPPDCSPENAPDCGHANRFSVSVVPSRPDRFGRGKSLYNHGALDEAAEELKAFLEESPDDTEARLILGDIYERKGMLREAVDQYVEVVRLAPEDKMTRFKLETALRQLK